MNLMDILTPTCVRVPLEATSRQGAIDELVDLVADAGRVSKASELKEAVWLRETTRTTGIGHGLAIPHGKCESVNDLAMAMGIPSEPIDFASIDGKPVRLIVLLASPIDRTSDHIQALARISRIMAAESFREKAFAATNDQELFDLIAAEEAARTQA